MSKVMKRVAKLFKIKQIKTTSYHPMSNSSLERYHLSLCEYLKTIVEQNDTWDEYLELATFCYNTIPHETHGFCPHELLFGTTARLPSGDELHPDEKLPTYEDYANII